MARDLAQRAERAVAQRGGGEGQPSLQKQLAQMEEQFQRAMPRGGEAVQLIRDVMTCVKQTPKLAQADQLTVLGAAMTCAQLGLRPGVGALGHAWILPFFDNKSGGQKAQLIIGYKGYVELGQRSDRIGSLHSRIVYTNDEFRLRYGLERDDFEHTPYFMRGKDEPGAARLFYAVGRLANGGTAMADPMTLAEMEAHRDRFAMAKYKGQVVGPWRDHFDAMGKKTMLLRLMALMPKSTEIARALDNDGGVRVDLSPGAIDSPEVVDGEYLGDAEPEQQAEPERERVTVQSSRGEDVPPPPADVPPSADEPPAEEVRMASKTQLAKLKQIRDMEKYDTDPEWFDALTTWVGRPITRDNEITAADADLVLDIHAKAGEK